LKNFLSKITAFFTLFIFPLAAAKTGSHFDNIYIRRN